MKKKVSKILVLLIITTLLCVVLAACNVGNSTGNSTGNNSDGSSGTQENTVVPQHVEVGSVNTIIQNADTHDIIDINNAIFEMGKVYTLQTQLKVISQTSVELGDNRSFQISVTVTNTNVVSCDIVNASSQDETKRLPFENSEGIPQETQSKLFSVPNTAGKTKLLNMIMTLEPKHVQKECEIIVAFSSSAVGGTVVSSNQSDGESFKCSVVKGRINTPNDLVGENSIVKWSHVKNALNYQIYVDGQPLYDSEGKLVLIPVSIETEVGSTVKCDLYNYDITSGPHMISIVAKGVNNYDFIDSTRSEETMVVL